MQYLILRFQAPMMSFGGVSIDGIGKTEIYVPQSMVVGLIANSLGYNHNEFNKIQKIQDEISIASRCDSFGEIMMDYQTVDLSQKFMKDNIAWTTKGIIEKRNGGSSDSKPTIIRNRYYIIDSVYTIAVALNNVSEVASAIQKPKRPLFLGRKNCLPSAPIFHSIVESNSPLGALLKIKKNNKLNTWWSKNDINQPTLYDEIKVFDLKDWTNKVHIGSRTIYHGLI